MQMISEDDRNLRDLSDEELDLAWDLWFDLAQTTNENDPPYTHGVFQRAGVVDGPEPRTSNAGADHPRAGSRRA
jgi:hypothetical protein